MAGEAPPADQIAAACAAFVMLMEEDDDEAFQMLMNVANLAGIDWMEMDGDEIGLGKILVNTYAPLFLLLLC